MPKEYLGLAAVGLVAVIGLLLRLFHGQGEARRRAQLRMRDGADPTPGKGAASQRYRFAHEALRSVALSDPIDFVRGMRASDALPRLQALWKLAGHGNHTSAPPHGLWHRVARLGPDVVLAVVRLPVPAETGEAHFAALVASELPLPATGLGDARFFTLELSRRLDTGASFTMICEWTKDGAHVNHGRGPDVLDSSVPGVSDRAFVDAIVARYLADRRNGYIRPAYSPPPLSGMSPGSRGS